MRRTRLAVRRTVEGALVATLPGGAGGAGGRTLSTHVATLGVMVKEIKPNGWLKLAQIGS